MSEYKITAVIAVHCEVIVEADSGEEAMQQFDVDSYFPFAGDDGIKGSVSIGGMGFRYKGACSVNEITGALVSKL